MKKIIAFFVAILFITITAGAQQSLYWNSTYFSACYSGGITSISPITGTVAGFSTADSTLPYVESGQPVDDTIYFKNFTNLAGNGMAVTSLKFDSIYLPSGLCWRTNKANNTYGAGEDGVIAISGFTNAPTGQYKLRIVTTWVFVGGLTVHVDLESFARIRYYLRVVCNSNAHPTINYVDTISTYTPYTTCPLPSSLSIYNPSGSIYCPGDTNDQPLFTVTGAGYRYKWSSGDTTSSIWPTVSGDYTVTVYSMGDSLVSAPVSIAVGPLNAAFQLTPDPSSPHTWTILNQCTVLQGDSNYIWEWGDNTTSIGVTPSHTYADSGYYTICVRVGDHRTCAASYCDSNVYLFKDQSQMVQMNVVLHPLGINDKDQPTSYVKYFGEAIHFSPTINEPSEIRLYDMSGRIVMKQSNWLGSSLAVDAVATGVYVVAIQNSSVNVSRKVLIGR